jgi:hypothetical protein
MWLRAFIGNVVIGLQVLPDGDRQKHAIASRGHVKLGKLALSIKSTTVLRLSHLPRTIPLSCMMKRVREDYVGEPRPAKVRRVIKFDRLSKLSDELLVRILSCVPVDTLLVCQRYHFLCSLSHDTLTLSGYQKSLAALP